MTPDDTILSVLGSLLDAGASKATILSVVGQALSTRQPLDMAAEKRRAWDREYRRKTRKSTRHQPDIHLTQVEKPSIYIEEKVLTVKQEKVKKVSKKKVLIDLPVDWRPPDRSFILAAENGVKIAEMEAKWRDYLKSSGKLYADHDAAFCNYIRNEPKFRPVAKQSRHDVIQQKNEKINATLDRFSGAAIVSNTTSGSRSLGEAINQPLPINIERNNGERHSGNGIDIYPISRKYIEGDLLTSDGDANPF